MNLTAKEAKLAQRLRKHERQWRYTRWVLLLGGAVLLVAWAGMLRYILDSSEATGDKRLAALLQVMAYPKVLFGMVIGAAMIGFALHDWWGSPTRVLLLKLLEEHQAIEGDSKKNADPGSAASGGRAEPPGNSGASEGPLSVT